MAGSIGMIVWRNMAEVIGVILLIVGILAAAAAAIAVTRWALHMGGEE